MSKPLPRSPRVLMFVPKFPYPVVGGLEKQAYELSRAFHKNGGSVQVVSAKFSKSHDRREMIDGVMVRRISWSDNKLLRFLFSGLELLVLFFYLRKTFDVVHVHQHSSIGLFVIALAKLIGKPVLVKLPNVGDYGIPGLRAGVLGGLRLRILLSADSIVAMSRQSVSELMHVNFPRERILQISNGITLDASNKQGGVDHDLCTVVFTGRLSEEKCLFDLIDAWSELRRRGVKKVALEIWGDGPLMNALREHAHILGLGSLVFFRGHVKDVQIKLRSVDLFVLPSRVEGNSNAILEAMNASLPIIASDVGGTAMQVGRDGAPFLFQAGDSLAMADRLELLILDKKLRRSTGIKMRARLEEVFDITKIADKYSDAYRFLSQGEPENIYKCSDLPVV